MCDKDTEILPQAGTLNRENPAVSSDRVKAPVAGAGRTDFGGDQSRIGINEIVDSHSPERIYPFAGKKLARTPPYRESENTSSEALSHIRVMEKPVQLGVKSTVPQDCASGDIKQRQEELAKLGSQIQDLLAFIMPKHNVHGDIKKKVNIMNMTYNRLQKLEQGRATTTGPKQTTSTQTSPRSGQKEATPSIEKNQEEDNKRKDISPPTDNRKVKKAMRRNERPSETHPIEVEIPATPNSEWEKVERRGKRTQQKQEKQKPQERPNQRSQHSLPNALIIQKKGELSYAEILSKVKKDTSLQEVGENVAKIRRTAGGDMILILSKTSQEKTSRFQTAIQGALGTDATVRSRIQETQIEIKDLDEITTDQEIIEALIAETGDQELGTKAIKSLRKAYYGTQSAVVTLPTEAAKKVTKVGKLRIGWAICRVRELLKPMKCYKCWQYGHIARNCNSSVDRSKSCIKCGKDGHKADKCTAEPCCILCSGGNVNEDVKHFAGSSRCPEYKKAYQALIQKR